VSAGSSERYGGPGLSCPNCGARAAVEADACAGCGYRFLEDATRTGRRRVRDVVLATGAIAAVVAAAVVLARDDPDPGEASLERPRPAPRSLTDEDVLSPHPLSARAAERRLEARFTSLRDDDSAAARCSARIPRPAHAIRRCRIRYPGGGERTVVVLTNPQGRELVVEPP
jgi:hypothetical protein